VSLQEVEAGNPHTRYQDQAKILGGLADMDFRFFPVVKNREQKYGLAVLSRFPIRYVSVGCLPALHPKKNAMHSERSQPTFPSRRPLFRIDHIFTSKHFRTLKTIVPINPHTRLASDHLPLCADMATQK
jgi:endonuclease/exonuclease/phosphatase family metal-dependent hydrolase